MHRVLIISYYWPPAGGPGVQRWLKFVTYFREFGVEPVMYVPKNPHYPIVDEALLEEVPQDITVLKNAIKEPYKLAQIFSKKKTKKMSSGVIPSKKQSSLDKLMLYVRGNYFIPDARVGWVKPSVEFLKEYLLEVSEEGNPIDIIITTGPPHSLHFIGLQLAEAFGIKWMADFRDPWTTIHYHKSLRLTAASEKKHKALEAKILNAADLITVTSPTTKKEFQEITSRPIEVVTNGYEVHEGLQPVRDSSFSVAHIGSLLSERNPEVLWEVLGALVVDNSDFKNDLEIKLAGTVSQDVVERIKANGLEDNVLLLGYIPHDEALQLQQNAQVLLLIEMDTPETRAIIPGKLFEYMAARRPIIALGPLASDIEVLLEETQTGTFFSYSDKALLTDHILDCYKNYKADTLSIAPREIEKYSRRERTKLMAEVIKSM